MTNPNIIIKPPYNGEGHMTSDDPALIFEAEINGENAGYALVVMPKNKNYSYVGQITVRPEYRLMGVATSLYSNIDSYLSFNRIPPLRPSSDLSPGSRKIWDKRLSNPQYGKTSMNWYGKFKFASRKSKINFRGILKQKSDGFLYLDINNNLLNGLYKMIDENGVEKPDSNVGAHISVMYADEIEKIKDIKEIGESFDFSILGASSVEPHGWEEMDRVWFLEVESPGLEKLRKKYKLSPKLNGHNFHITFAVRKK